MILLVPTLLFAAAAPPVAAISSNAHYLYESCSALVRFWGDRPRPGMDVNLAPYCLGYFHGSFQSSRLCPLTHISSEMVQAYVVYMDRHPELLEKPEQVGFYGAMEHGTFCRIP